MACNRYVKENLKNTFSRECSFLFRAFVLSVKLNGRVGVGMARLNVEPSVFLTGRFYWPDGRASLCVIGLRLSGCGWGCCKNTRHVVRRRLGVFSANSVFLSHCPCGGHRSSCWSGRWCVIHLPYSVTLEYE